MNRFPMISMLLVVLCLITSQVAGVAESREVNSYQRVASENMTSLRIMVAKLRELVLSLKDVDDLEKIGLPHSDAQLMRLALQEKINQAQSETLALIRRL